MIFEQKISEELFQQKYMLNGESTPDAALQGIAEEIAEAEKPSIRRK